MTIVMGFILGAIAFTIDFPAFGDVKIITENWGIPYMMQGWWLFVILSIIYFTVSYLTPKPRPDQIDLFTLDNPLSFITKGKITGISDPRVLSGILVVIMIILYSIFS